MEEELDVSFNTQKKLNRQELKDYNSLVFAFIGDSVHTLFVRTHFILELNAKAGKLHTLTSKCVNAGMQAKMLDFLMEELTEEELEIVKRTRNVKNKTTAKNFNLEDYKKATSFEALIGYLYLLGETKRMNELLNKTLKVMENV